MILELKFRNWKSFRDETRLNLVATDERRLSARVPRLRRSPALKASPVAALYGGNASGKSNLFSLLAFLRWLVLTPPQDGRAEIPLEPFALSDEGRRSPTEVSLTFLAADDAIYELALSLSSTEVLEESLSQVRRNGVVPLYRRSGREVRLLHPALERSRDARACALLVGASRPFLGFAGQHVPALGVPLLWFRDQLTLIDPRTSFHGFRDMFASGITDVEALSGLLADLDTGIRRLGLEETSLAALPRQVPATELAARLGDGGSLELNLGGLRYVISKDGDRLTVRKMVSYHRAPDGGEAQFDLGQESEGSLRLLDILPAFIDLERNGSRKVYVIDELDRSWHYLLSRRLLGIYLSRCSEATRSQLLFSTHDIMLMDQSLFRRDEMLVTERGEDGASTLFSFADFAIRHDKDIRKLYLSGALGGVPRLSRYGSLLGAAGG
jgi:hypothetical protein